MGLPGDEDCCLNLVTVTESAVLMSLGHCGTAPLSEGTFSVDLVTTLSSWLLFFYKAVLPCCSLE